MPFSQTNREVGPFITPYFKRGKNGVSKSPRKWQEQDERDPRPHTLKPYVMLPLWLGLGGREREWKGEEMLWGRLSYNSIHSFIRSFVQLMLVRCFPHAWHWSEGLSTVNCILPNLPNNPVR